MKILGTLHRVDEDRGAVRVEDVYATDIEDLWEACTRARPPRALDRERLGGAGDGR